MDGRRSAHRSSSCGQCGQQVWRTDFCTQFMVLSKRTTLNLIRNPATSLFQLVCMVGFSMLVGGEKTRHTPPVTRGVDQADR